MRKIIVFGLILLLTACNTPNLPSEKTETNGSKDKEEEIIVEKEENSQELAQSEEKESATENPETTIESKEAPEETTEKSTDAKTEKELEDKEEESATEKEQAEEEMTKEEVETESSSEETIDEDEKAVQVKMTEEDYKQLARVIIEAQIDHDFNKLAKMSTTDVEMDEVEETMIFKNVTYPHEQPLLTAETATAVEYRYMHEVDEQSVIVGYAAYDEVDEYSYTIDFTFLLQDGEWLLNDMDRNK